MFWLIVEVSILPIVLSISFNTSGEQRKSFPIFRIFLAPPLEELYIFNCHLLTYLLTPYLRQIFALALSVSLSLTLVPLAEPR